MGRKEKQIQNVSRRSFLGGLSYMPLLFIPAPLASAGLRALAPGVPAEQSPSLPFAEYRLTPHYPANGPLDDVLRYVPPGSDEYAMEKYAAEIAQRLGEWARELKSEAHSSEGLERILAPSLRAASLVPEEQTTLRSGYGVDVMQRRFASEPALGRDRFLEEFRAYLAALERIATAEFEITAIEQTASSPLSVRLGIRYELVGTAGSIVREQRIGRWLTEWLFDQTGFWQAFRWTATAETVSRARLPAFHEVTAQALGRTEAYKNQLLRGTDYWRTVLDGACGIDVYGNTGIAAGDFDGDGLDDLYVCQPAGLPNRLYRNCGDGTFEDVTDRAGVGVLDGTACALFADFENRGRQDLLVVCARGPLLFRNQGNGKFLFKPDAFRFANPPTGTFTHAAAADYDGDGRLDVYFCLYSYYLGLDQYRYPVPYFDARNGPANFLFHNEGDGVFEDCTAAAGLHIDNDRYTFACVWGHSSSGGSPDLYVVNDFGRNNLYRNNGDGTFTAISAEARVDEVGAGMSACWLDYDNDGHQDIYAAGMWVAAGMRIAGQAPFHGQASEEARRLYQRHLLGNSLYRDLGDGKFENVAERTGAEMGRWSWSADSWDFDHDGFPDLYVANGYITGLEERDVSSFFWRQVVAKSPETAIPSESYERGWNAINELVRSDSTWNGHERNVVLVNNRDGTFSDVSGVVGLDFPDDSRSFALADLDLDGRLEIVLKNRTAPQVRILHNAMSDLGSSIAFRLRGRKSNRDAIGSAVTVESNGHRQTKYLEAGSGFLSQHSKELFFGIGKTDGTVRATIRWPSGLTQAFEPLPANHRIELEEGSEDFRAKPFVVSPPAWARPSEPPVIDRSPNSFATWLLASLPAPDFSLADLRGSNRQLSSFRGHLVLLHFWAMAPPACHRQLELLQKNESNFAARDLELLCLNVDRPEDQERVKTFASGRSLTLPILLATERVAGVYNIIYRFLFDRRRDLGIPTSLLLNRENCIVKVYQGEFDPLTLLKDTRAIPDTPAGFREQALPFAGGVFREEFQRNHLTCGVALFQHGYLEEAAAAFEQVTASTPDDPIAYYNLGTLYLEKNEPARARPYLDQAVKLRPGYAEAWNNLGMVSAQQGREEEALEDFKRSLLLRPDYATALVNLANLLRHQGAFDEAQKLLERALKGAPNNPDANYSMGMLYARQNQLPEAAKYLERAAQFRPDSPEILNNLGVLLVRQGHYPEAKEKFETSIRVAPNSDQAYLNLAKLYVLLNEREKARQALRDLLRRQPEHKLAQQTLEMLD
jgi:Flp pilus assembly protein TadD/peroxiredoxin